MSPAEPRTVAVVSDGVLGAVVPLAGQIRQVGARPVLLTGEPAAAGLEAWHGVYDRIVVMDDPGDEAALARAATEAAGGIALAGLFSCFDGLCLPAARAARDLGLPHPALAGLAAARDKGATRAALERHRIPSIPARRIRERGDLEDAAAATGFPAVLKPVDGTASHFVRRVDDRAQLDRAFDAAARKLLDSWPALHRSNSEFLLEAYVTGREYSLDLVVRDGEVRRIAAFEKFIVDEAGFLECAFASPFLQGGDALVDELWEYVERCVQAVGLDDTLAHVEVIATTAGPRLIEINAGRPGGQIIPRAVLDMAGVDLLAELVALQTGAPAPAPRPPVLDGQVATYTVFPPRSGRVAELRGVGDLCRHEHVVAVLPYCSAGDRVDVEDKEFFAVNVLTCGLAPDRLVPFYDEIRATVEVVVEA